MGRKLGKIAFVKTKEKLKKIIVIGINVSADRVRDALIYASEKRREM